jgi:hypothetical protein
LVRLESSAPINPHSEQTLKGNTENGYCRSFYAEFFPMIYLPEFKLYKGWIKNKLDNNDRSEWMLGDKLKEKRERIRENFYRKPLKEIVPPPKGPKQLQVILMQTADIISGRKLDQSIELVPQITNNGTIPCLP